MKGSLLLVMILTASLLCESYWQQYVHYKIRAKLDPDKNMIYGSEILRYTNNSPDELDRVYFRLYWNVFKEGSRGYRFAERIKFFQEPRSDMGVKLKKFAVVVDGVEQFLDYKIDDTILEAKLPRVLRPGETIVFKIEWEERVPPAPGMRTGHKNRNYDIAQWYPQIAVYDRYGWHKDQYIGMGEFHNDFGTFEVEIEIPRSFIVAYTGELLNPEDVLPDSILRKLAEARSNPGKILRIADFSDRKITDIDRDTYVVWKFKAEDVRDFAWSAYERYIWDVVFWENREHPDGGVMIHALYFDEVEDEWREAVKFGYHAIKFFSENYGLYVYPNAFIMASYAVGGGMEYPGIVFIGYSIKNRPYRGLFGVIVHELGHQWYPMMIGSNETEFAFMDEGFNSFITNRAFESYYGRYKNLMDTTLWYLGHFTDSRELSHRQYLLLARTGFERPIATHADRWDERYPAMVAFYPKTAAVMDMLEYVLGDSIFSILMKEYYRRWRFKHPYPDDFYKLAMEVSGNRDLRWFFDQWFHRSYTCDYGIGDIDYEILDAGGRKIYRTKIKIFRGGRAIMPIDILIKMEDGKTHTVLVPVDLWMNNEMEREVTVDLLSRPKYAEINPDMRIADINRLNNTYPHPKVMISFDNTISIDQILTPLDSYWIRWRPSMWYNVIDKVKIGLKLRGSYLIDTYKINSWLLYGIGSGRINFNLSYRTRIPFEISRNTFAGFDLFMVEGRIGGNFQASKRFSRTLTVPPFHNISFKLSYLKVQDNRYIEELFRWEPGKLFRIMTTYSYFNRGRRWRTNFTLTFESSIVPGDFNYSKVSAELVNWFNLPFGFNFGFRLFGGYGDNLPNQVRYFIASSSPVEQFKRPIFRSRIFPKKLSERLHDAGGGNLRGYISSNSGGEKIYALNLELNFPMHLFNLFSASLFFDAGKIWNGGMAEDLKYDLGFGLRTSIFENLSRITSLFRELKIDELRFDFPIYLSHPPDGEDKVKFRWIIGVEKVL